ncbi:hypothetical protein P3T22_004279, partial [Paraburkholderia sp. GAS348]
QRIFSEADADFASCLRSSRCAASAPLKILCLATIAFGDIEKDGNRVML